MRSGPTSRGRNISAHARRHAVPRCLRAVWVAAMLLAAVCAYAVTPARQAAAISDQAFAMLSGLNAASGGGAENSAVGPMAVFAGDAQTLSHALAAGDRSSAGSAMAALKADEKSVDAVAGSHPHGFDANQWNAIKRQMTALEAAVPSAAAAPRAEAAPIAPPPIAHAGASAAEKPATDLASTSGLASHGAPQVVIESRSLDGNTVRVKGYMEGSDLARAGLFENGRELRAFHIGKVAGEERVNFDLGLGNPSSATTIRVFDSAGRMGEASVLEPGAGGETPPAAAAPAAEGAAAAANEPEIPAMRPPNAPTEEAGVEVDRNSPNSPAGNLAVIPSYGAPRPSPSKRHTMASRLADFHIDVIAVNQVQTQPPIYEIIGQIEGRGVNRAGIYINGRLVHRIPVATGAPLNSFDQRFTLEGGAPTIRAYAMGDRFIETPVDLSNSLASAEPMPPAAAAPMTGGAMLGGAPIMTAGIAIQIAAVGSISPTQSVVSGVISGKHIVSAGLYQNGMLVQAIQIRHGIGAMIGSFLPGSSNNVNFNVRFDPQAGPATIRAYSGNGIYAEQPVVAGATNNPYAGGTTTYGGSYSYSAPPIVMTPYSAYGASPYGMSPYGYGMSPYGMSPYGMSPYGYGASPYGMYAPAMPPNGVYANPGAASPYSGGTFGAPPINPYAPPTNPFSGAPVR
jgi:hypothetical protein